MAASVRERSPARRSPRRRVDLTSIELSGLGGAVGEDLLALGQPVPATKLGLAPTSIEVRQAAFTVAEQVTSSPTWTGRMNVIRSTAAVTDAAAAVADRRDTGDLVAELHDHAAMNE